MKKFWKDVGKSCEPFLKFLVVEVIIIFSTIIVLRGTILFIRLVFGSPATTIRLLQQISDIGMVGMFILHTIFGLHKLIKQYK